MSEFRATAPSAPAVFYRSYSRRKEDGTRENFEEAITRTISAIADIGNFTDEQRNLALTTGLGQYCFPSGRSLWVAGTDWSKKPENYPGYYNCCSMHVEEVSTFGLLMELAMMGTGTGAVLEKDVIEKLPVVQRSLKIKTVKPNKGVKGGSPDTEIKLTAVKDGKPTILVRVGDSRQGWAAAYQGLIELAMGQPASGEDLSTVNTEAAITLDLSQVRQAGELLKGFGGTANPIRLQETLERVCAVLTKAVGRKLTATEVCLLIDEAASAVVAGNIRRCLPEDALVHTSTGLVPIKDVQVGDMVQTPMGFKRVSDKFDQGVQNVYELDTNGPSPRGTLEHRYAVLKDATGTSDWVKVKDLKESDRLLHSTLVLPGQRTTLPVDFTEQRPPSSHTAKGLIIPALDSNIAWLIGFTHGNGYVSVGRSNHNKPYGYVSWSTNALDEEQAQSIYEKINNALACFGLSAVYAVVRNENTAKVTCSSIRLAEYFLEHIKQPKVALTIPSFILRGTPDLRAGYLAGLMDSDGSIGGRPPILVTTVYKNFARQVAALYSSLGIASRSRVTIRQNENWQTLHHVTLPALKGRYNDLVAPYSIKGRVKQGQKTYGFTVPGQIMREAYACMEMNSMRFAASRKIDANYETYIAESEIDLDIPVRFKEIGGHDCIQTYDIEVEDAHCFYCDGYLTHNSAGMRQFSSDDFEAAESKEGLYKQDEDGNWAVDPEKEALRMANHTRCYHTKPSLAEIKDAVTKQYWSGEGAIQYVPESIARANADLLDDAAKKKFFLDIYTSGNKTAAQEYLKTLAGKAGEPVDDRILSHRMERYGLNPCFAPGTIVMTREGYYPIESLAGKEVEIHDGKEWRMIDNFRVTAYDQDVYNVTLYDGTVITATEYHPFILADGTRVELKDLQPGDELMASTAEPVEGKTEAKAAYLKGFLIGDGTSDKNRNHAAICKVYAPKKICADRLRSSRLELGDLEGETLTPSGYIRGLGTANENLSAWCYNYKKDFPYEVLNWTDKSKAEFIAGLFDADGTLRDTKQNGFAYQITSIHKKFLIGLVALLRTLKIGSKIGPPRVREFTDFGPERGGICRTQDNYRLAISQANSIKLSKFVNFERLKSVADREVVSFRKLRYNQVKEISYAYVAPEVYCCTVPCTHSFTLGSMIVISNCGEILMRDGLCNLSEIHLNTINPTDAKTQEDAFYAGGLQVAALLQHEFVPERLAYSRKNDPIVGVSFTGLFDFFVHAFGAEWLGWMMDGRPGGRLMRKFSELERQFLIKWRLAAERGVEDYCKQAGLRMPNRCTTVQPAGSKSLLTGASPGWHPPKAQRFIRRITFGVRDPLVSALRDYGYSVIPAQSARDEKGNLLDDINDPRVQEVLVEIPTEVSWANMPGCDEFDLSQLSVEAQWGLYIQVQTFYTMHNCFSRDTQFLTNQGVKSFDDYEVGDTVTVLNLDGDWVPASVVNTGDERPMLKITLREGKTGNEKVITSTYCHRFPVKRASGGNSRTKIVEAEDLRVGYEFITNSDPDCCFPPESCQWKVVAIEPTDPQLGWCVMEPKTSHFTLSDNILVMNTSATLEFREDEIDLLSNLIYENIRNDGGYISAALLARFDANETFPRLPFEPIDKATYDRRMAAVMAVRSVLPEDVTMLDLLKQYDNKDYELKGAAGCDSAKCLLEAGKDTDQVGKLS